MAVKNEKPVWLITGCSTGFGREIALAALASGARVVVTARKPDSVADIVENFPQTALACALDITDQAQIDATVESAVNEFSRIDVLVNNAGYGYLGAIEEGEDSAVRQLFETNFFGALAMTKAVLPHMRHQGSGHIINNSSQAGLMGNLGTGYYSATKYALEGLMESLTKELKPLGIHVTSVQPGPFRTDWAGRSMQRSSVQIADYEPHVGGWLALIAAIDKQQPGDPVRASKIIVDLAAMEEPPTQLLLGSIVLSSYRDKLKNIAANLNDWEAVTLSADYPS